MSLLSPAILVALLLLASNLACGPRVPAEAAEIVAFEPPEATVRPGGSATALVRVRNDGARTQTFFLGYSVRDPSGAWHDAPPVPVELGPGDESGPEKLRTPPLRTPGYYDSRVSVWSEEPGAEGARRIANRETTSSFRVSGKRENFDTPDRWQATSRKLGRGDLTPENAAVEGGQLRITLPANSLDGGELESKDLYGPGFYAARIKVPNAPSSITGFFLYHPPDLASEIGIEVFNDPSGKVLFTTYARGDQTHTEEAELPFDPTKDFHDYAFLYERDSVTFYVDGEPMRRYEGGLPSRSMKLYVNSWYPAWLDGREAGSDRHVYVEWIER